MNMKIIKNIKIKNFLSHQSSDIVFSPEQKLLINGVSGAGKSSIVEAFTWCLYGSGRIDNRSLIRKGTTKAEVEVVIFNDKTNVYHRITRSISDKNKHVLSLETSTDGESYEIEKINGVKECQDFIEKKIVGSSYLLFVNSVVYLQEHQDNFAKQTAAKRKDIILEIIRASDYDEYFKISKEMLSSEKETESEMSIRAEEKTKIINDNIVEADKVEEYEKLVQELKNEVSVIDAKKDAIFKEKELIGIKISKASSAKTSVELNLNELSKNKAEIKKCEDSIKTIDSFDYSVFNVKKEDIESLEKLILEKDTQNRSFVEWSEKSRQINSKMPPLRDFDGEIKRKNEEIIKVMSEKIPSCHKCGTPYLSFEQVKNDKISTLTGDMNLLYESKSSQDNIIANIHKELEDIGVAPSPCFLELDEARKKLTALKSKEDEMSATKRYNDGEKKSLNLKIELLVASCLSIEQEIAKLSAEITGADDLDVLYKQKENDLSAIESNRRLMGNELVDANSKWYESQRVRAVVNKAKEELSEISKKLSVANKNVECLSLVKDAFGPNGIRTIVIDLVIPQLEEKINDVLGRLSDFRIRIDTQKSGITGETVLEGLFISIINGQGEEFDYNSYSGGEKIKINMAIFEGLASLQDIGFRFLDESVVGLDENTIESFSEVILSLKESVSQLVCISHIQSVKDLFEDKITIVKNNGVSKIKN